MGKVSFFLQKEIWLYLNSKGKSPIRTDVCSAISSSEIHTDIPKEVFLDDDNLFQIWNDKGGNIEFDFGAKVENELESLSATALSSMYLVDRDTEYCEVRSKTHGMVVLNKELLDRNPKFFRLQDIYISKSRDTKYKKGWEEGELSSILGSRDCNAIIIVDPFICKDGNVYRMNENLVSLLKVLLPEKLSDISFQISIFSKFDPSQGAKLYGDIYGMIEIIRPNLKPKLTLYQTHEIHDRMIMSNTFMIEVGAGFALFKNGNPVNETKVLYWPYKKDDYYYRIKSAKKIDRNAYSNENLSSVWGDKENRLFDLV